ncbi:MAG: GxxExxY protein [Anaerolineales bacterium]|nr:GxxExxY protein [Anaerolineales bacterium]
MRVGNFYAALLVNDTVLVESKAVRALNEIHTAQCLDYLQATGMPICLLVNFLQAENGNPAHPSLYKLESKFQSLISRPC